MFSGFVYRENMHLHTPTTVNLAAAPAAARPLLRVKKVTKNCARSCRSCIGTRVLNNRARLARAPPLVHKVKHGIKMAGSGEYRRQESSMKMHGGRQSRKRAARAGRQQYDAMARSTRRIAVHTQAQSPKTPFWSCRNGSQSELCSQLAREEPLTIRLVSCLFLPLSME